MRNITEEELKEILEQHKLWLDSDGVEGERANLCGAHLIGVDLTNIDLTRADLASANLYRANFFDADLSRVDLFGADLSGANLRGANLTYANLTCADLSGANLRCANLRCANLQCANLTDTILDEKEQYRKGIVVTEPIVGYKKSNEGKIITLEIPVGAKVFSISNDKRRTNKAKVIDMQGNPELSSMYDTDFKYHVGDEIEIIDFNDNYNIECSTGIHFFLTREEAEKYIF